MRNIVIHDEFSERDIRPGLEMTEYLSLVQKDVWTYFKGDLITIECPGCLSSNYNPVFERFGFDYVGCEACGTVFMNPRPSQECVNTYYKESDASKFWLSQFIKTSDLSRKDHIYVPRVDWVSGTVKDCKVSVKRYLDVFSKYEVLLKLLAKRLDFKNGFMFCPMVSGQDLEGYEVLENMEGKNGLDMNVVTAFEVIERVTKPDAFIRVVRNVLAPNALFFLTTSTIDGFEHQALWEKSKNIFPPDHMTLFSINGITQMLGRNGFNVLEVSTPGILDIDIVMNQVSHDKNIEIPRFLEKILKSDNPELKNDFQSFLQKNRLSSYLRISCQSK